MACGHCRGAGGHRRQPGLASAYETYESENYKIVPDNEAGCFDIYNKQGEKLGVFNYSDIKVRQDSGSGKQFLISEHGTMSYDVMVMDGEMKEALQNVMGGETLETVDLQGFTLKTHPGTGIQYLVRNGEEGRGGKVLLQSEADIKKYEELAQTYLNKYPNLIESKKESYIWADLEIKGLAQHTNNGIISMVYDGISYNDNSDDKKNWSIRFSGDTYKLIFDWLQSHRESIEEMQKFIEPIAEKASQDKSKDYDEKAFDMVGPNAPQAVKDAWMEAAKEVGANGLGIKRNGMLSHISQMMVQRLNKMLKGETEKLNILGNTVESAIIATKQALYNLEHPKVYTPRSIEVLQARIKEGEFYTAFLEKLEKL